MRAAIAIAVLLGCAAPRLEAQQQNQQYLQDLRVQLTRVAAILADSGYTAPGGLTFGTLNAGAREIRPVSLTSGVHYLIIAVCDQDCTDLDLRLTGPNRRLVIEDVLTDAKPLLEFTAPATGQYALMLMMASCAHSPCYWGYQVFRK